MARRRSSPSRRAEPPPPGEEDQRRRIDASALGAALRVVFVGIGVRRRRRRRRVSRDGGVGDRRVRNAHRGITADRRAALLVGGAGTVVVEPVADRVLGPDRAGTWAPASRDTLLDAGAALSRVASARLGLSLETH